MEMRTTKRALAGAAAVTGAGMAVLVVPVDPAGAHETNLRLGGATAAVGAGHSGIRVCNNDDTWPFAFARWRRSPGGGIVQGGTDLQGGDCWSGQSTGGVYEWQLCLSTYPGAEPDHTCTGWKRA
jgi:hypothetical protein